ncbi:hypothetical protein C8F01DRAFT_31023 [Mycena amicta]|nr:hypothetical protein C8F01DRAFT_31023 [Mycena amicta]
METRIHVYPGREHRRAYLTNARNKLANTLLLTVFDPTLESRQFYDTGGTMYFSDHSSVLGPACQCAKVMHIQSTLGAVMRIFARPTLPWFRRPALQPFVDSWHQREGNFEVFLRSNQSNREICARVANVALELLLYRTTEINDRLRTPNTCIHCTSPHDFLIQRQHWSVASQWCRTLISAPHVRALYDRLFELAETTFVVWPGELEEDGVKGLIDWLKVRRVHSNLELHLKPRN